MRAAAEAHHQRGRLPPPLYGAVTATDDAIPGDSQALRHMNVGVFLHPWPALAPFEPVVGQVLVLVPELVVLDRQVARLARHVLVVVSKQRRTRQQPFLVVPRGARDEVVLLPARRQKASGNSTRAPFRSSPRPT